MLASLSSFIDQSQKHASVSPLQPHWDLYPAHYVAQPAPVSTVASDGDLSKPAWRDNVPWSTEFGDIQGKDAPADAMRPALTRFKALYDDKFLYLAALLHPAAHLATEAHFRQRNDPIYQEDSDFEVFVDLAMTNHNYKELEINAINTVWNLMLDKPYEDGGHEHSGRVANPDESDYYEVYHQRTGTRVLEGKLNDHDTNQGALWSVELALAFSDLQVHAPLDARLVPGNSRYDDNDGDFDSVLLFRINFSRVERQGLINWTWQPQVRWDPANQRFAGFVNMHYPDSWGYMQLGGRRIVRDPQWPARLTAMTVYYALHYHKELTGSFTSNLNELVVPNDIVDPFDIQIALTDHGDGFNVTVSGNDTTTRVCVRDDRLLSMLSSSQPSSKM